MNEDDQERYVRWQNYRITQLTFSINLFLTFAVAALGFSLALIKDEKFIPPVGSGALLRDSVFALAGSVVFGALATLTRLADFRCTALKILKKYSGWRQAIVDFGAERLGGVSWALFYLQLATLGYGAYRLISVLLTTYGEKLAR